jgi:hypothetical protein
MRPPVNFAEAKKMYPKYKVILDRIAQLAATDRVLTHRENKELEMLHIQDGEWRATLFLAPEMSYGSKQTVGLFCDLKKVADVSVFATELRELLAFCNQLSPSERTHYQGLDEWSDPVYEFAHKKLEAHKFINGGAAMGITQPPMADLWWSTYAMISGIINSPYLKSEVAAHHSSAHSRNEALKKELEAIIKIIS